MLSYVRPNRATYINENGESVLASANQPRLNHREGDLYPLGIKFGDGDRGYIPNEINALWKEHDGVGTFVVIGQAPNGLEWFRCGDVSIEGVHAHKLHIINAEASEIDSRINLFRSSPNVDENCHVLMVKYYAEDITDELSGEEWDAMNELNQFTHGAWY